MKTGVLIHGCNLSIENWRHVAWGDPPGKPGRIPQGLLVAAQVNAQVIVMGTGASRKKFNFSNSPKSDQILSEAEYSLEYLKLYFDKLVLFDAMHENVLELRSSDSAAAFEQSLLEKIILDTKSNNTSEEIRNAGELFAQNGVEAVYLVSSPTHVVRCLRDAAQIYHSEERFSGFSDSIRAVPSTTCYEGTSAGDVVVVEPPHRPDRHVVPTHRRIQRMLALQKLPHEDLVELIDEFDDLLQKYENRYFNR